MMAEAVHPSSPAEEAPPNEETSFEAVVLQHQRMIYSLCYRMTGAAEDAEDLTQETFLQAYRHFPEFRGDASVSSWLYRIAMNLCLTWVKRRQRRERVYAEWAQEDHRPAPERPVHAARVQEALLQLKPAQRAAVVLTVYDGLTHGEAARVLGCSETTVSWRLFTARRKLKRLLRDLQEVQS